MEVYEHKPHPAVVEPVQKTNSPIVMVTSILTTRLH